MEAKTLHFLTSREKSYGENSCFSQGSCRLYRYSLFSSLEARILRILMKKRRAKMENQHQNSPLITFPNHKTFVLYIGSVAPSLLRLQSFDLLTPPSRPWSLNSLPRFCPRIRDAPCYSDGVSWFVIQWVLPLALPINRSTLGPFHDDLWESHLPASASEHRVVPRDALFWSFE